MGCRESVALPSVTETIPSCCTRTASDDDALSMPPRTGSCTVGDTDSSTIWISTRQKQLIRATWSTLVPGNPAEYEQLGFDVFLRIFSRHPELLQLFPFGRIEPLHQMPSVEQRVSALLMLRNHPAFCSHAAAFVYSIGMAVDTLDDWDNLLTDTLLTLGAGHSTTKGFTVRNFEVFAESLIHVWKQRLTNAMHADSVAQQSSSSKPGSFGHQVGGASLIDIMHAWEILFIFIMMKLRDGYRMARRQSIDSIQSERAPSKID